MDDQQGLTVAQETAQCHVAGWIGGEFWGEWYVYIFQVLSHYMLLQDNV